MAGHRAGGRLTPWMTAMIHQYLVRETGAVATEQLIADRFVRFAYNRLREQAPTLFRALTGPRVSSLLGFWHYDLDLPLPAAGARQLLERMGVDPCECLDPPEHFTTARQVFERRSATRNCGPWTRTRARWSRRPTAAWSSAASPDTPALFIKEKFFSMPELLGERTPWPAVFADGDFAVFRLTPDKYHYNHVPVSGRGGRYLRDSTAAFHSCNPGAVLALASLHAKNRRVVTIIDTDVAGGTGIGLVAMVEVVALMIGDIVQCYSAKLTPSPNRGPGHAPGTGLPQEPLPSGQLHRYSPFREETRSSLPKICAQPGAPRRDQPVFRRFWRTAGGDRRAGPIDHRPAANPHCLHPPALDPLPETHAMNEAVVSPHRRRVLFPVDRRRAGACCPAHAGRSWPQCPWPEARLGWQGLNLTWYGAVLATAVTLVHGFCRSRSPARLARPWRRCWPCCS